MTDAKTLDILNTCFRAGGSFHTALEQINFADCQTTALLSRYWRLLEMERNLASTSQVFLDRAVAAEIDRVQRSNAETEAAP